MGNAMKRNIRATGVRALLAATVLVAGMCVGTATAAAAALAPFDSHLTRAPYLTDLVGRHVSVNFATDQSATSGSVTYAAVAGDGSCTPATKVTATRRTVKVGTVSQYQWTADLNLPASGTYCYRAYLATTDLLAGNASPRFTTQVPVGSDESFSFDVTGDWGQVDSSGANPRIRSTFLCGAGLPITTIVLPSAMLPADPAGSGRHWRTCS